MRVMDFPRALVALLGFVAMAPAVSYYLTSSPALDVMATEDKLIAGFALPIMALLFLASWLSR